MDRLHQSAAAVSDKLVASLYQLQLIQYHMGVTRMQHGVDWPTAPKSPRDHPFLYHNDCKTIAAIIRCKIDIENMLNDSRSSQDERELILRHPVWRSVKEECNIDAPVLRTI